VDSCLKTDEVEAYIAGTLSADDQARFEAHVASCASCRKAVKACGQDIELAHDIQQAYGEVAVSDSSQTMLSQGPGETQEDVESIEGYEILHEIHRGGQGVVYKAVQLATKRTVALKVLLHGPYASAKQQHRFEREIDLIASLQHPNIVTVYDSGVAQGHYYFAMEYIHGLPLDTYMSAKNWDVDETLQLFQKICSAVNSAHQRGVIHRDLKPANIRVDMDGEPHVLDFGLAKAAGPDLQGGVPVTATGEFMGTLAYASPEQTMGDPNMVDIRTDVYSLGVILFEMLTGEYPYKVTGSMADVLNNIAEAEPKRPSTFRRQINNEIETIVLQALAKEKHRRYQSAEALARDVSRYLAGEAIEAKRNSAFYILRKTVVRHRRWVFAGVLLFMLLAVFGVVSFNQAHKNHRLAMSEGAARARADATANALETELIANRIKRGRLFTRTGNLSAAEDLIWREHLKNPQSPHSYWALWELYSQNPNLTTFVGHDKGMRDIVFAPNGQVFATASGDSTIKIWNTQTFEPAGRLVGHSAAVYSAAYSPDGRWIASASYDGTVKIWDAATHKLVHDLHGHEGKLWTVDFAADGKYVISGGGDTEVRIWEADTGACIRVIQDHQAPISAVCYNRNTQILATCSADGTIKLWKDLAGPSITTLTADETAMPVLAFSPDGRMLAWGGRESRRVNLWHLTEPPTMESFGKPDNGNVLSIVFGIDGRTLIVGGWFRVDEWNLAAHSRRTLIELGTVSGAVSPDGHWIATASTGGSIRVTDLRVNAGEIRLGGRSNVGAASISPDGRIIACGEDTDHIRLWEIAAGKLLAKLPCTTGRWSSAYFHPSGNIIATCGVDGVVELWDLESGSSIYTIEGVHVTSGQSLAFSPDGLTLAVTRPDKTVQILDAMTGDVSATLPSLGSEALAVRFSPDGRTIATTHRGRKVALWTATGSPLGSLDIGSAPWTVGFSPDSRKLAVGCWGRQFQIWSLDTRMLEQQIGGTKAVFWGASYMPTDTSIIATCSGCGAVQLWDLREQRNLLTIEPFGGSDALSATFTPDGKTLVASGFDGSLCIWDLEYYDRHIAGNLEYQIDLLRDELGDAVQTEHLRAWAKDVLRRPWPRIGPGAQRRADPPEAAAKSQGSHGTSPEVIAAWGAKQADSNHKP